jgi:hypothetical protein
MARTEKIWKGYKFTFPKASGDFKGEVVIKEYEHDDGLPNELILTCQEHEYNISTDIASFSDEKQVEEKTDTSIGKTVGKVALAGVAGKAVQSNRFGTAGMLASVSQGMGTEKTTTKTSHDVMIQFTDGNMLLLPSVPSDEFKKLQRAYRVFNYESYRKEIEETLKLIEKEIADTKEKLSTLPSSKKKAAFEKIDILNHNAEVLPANNAKIRATALKKGLVAELTPEEQKLVDAEKEKKLKKLQSEKGRLEKKAKKREARLTNLTDFQYATKHGYDNLRVQRGIVGIIFLSWITCGLFIPWEIWKRKENKKKWDNILTMDPELKAFKEFRQRATDADSAESNEKKS